MTFIVHEPETLPDAVRLLAAEGDAAAALAGGTDLLLRIRKGSRRYRSIVNLKRVPHLGGITTRSDGSVTIGALTTFRQIETHNALRSRVPALSEAAHVVAGVQLRHLATIGGNLGNASPSADSTPPLVALGARVEIASTAGPRELPVEACITGPGRTALATGEIFTAIRIPAVAARSGSAFSRFSPRAAMDIGIASVAASVTLDADGRCVDCRIALGGVSPVPLHATAAEAALRGERLAQALARHAGSLAAAAATPISDIRGSAAYRRALVAVLTTRVVLAAAARAEGGAH